MTLKRLTTTVEEEKSRHDLLEHYVNREETASKVGPILIPGLPR